MTRSQQPIPEDYDEFVRVVDELLTRRRQEATQGKLLRQSREWPRKWKSTELGDMVYPSYFVKDIWTNDGSSNPDQLVAIGNVDGRT